MNSPISLLSFFNIASLWGVIYFIYIQKPVAGSDPLETITTLLYPSAKNKVVSSQVYSRNWRLKHFQGFVSQCHPKKNRTSADFIHFATRGNLSFWPRRHLSGWMQTTSVHRTTWLHRRPPAQPENDGGRHPGRWFRLVHLQDLHLWKERKMIDSPKLKGIIFYVTFQGCMMLFGPEKKIWRDKKKDIPITVRVGRADLKSKVALSQKLKYSFPVFWHILPTHMPEDTYPKRLGHKIDISRVLLCRYCIS